MDITVYSLHMTFGLLVLPEFAPFAHAAYLEARVVEIGLYSDIMDAFKMQWEQDDADYMIYRSYLN